MNAQEKDKAAHRHLKRSPHKMPSFKVVEENKFKSTKFEAEKIQILNFQIPCRPDQHFYYKADQL